MCAATRPLFAPDTPGGSQIRPNISSIGVKPLPPTTARPTGTESAVVIDEPPPPKIQAFEQRSGRKHEDTWSRSPNVTGTGAIHCKSFHCKLNDEALGYLDQQINEWLDAHPQYEVKFTTTVSGEWQGKMGKEIHMVVQVWV
jgi:hypothetical protein